MNENQLRKQITKFVLVSNAILYVLIVIYYMFKGLDQEEFSVLIGMLSPITTVYIAAIVKYAIENKNSKENNHSDKKVSKFYQMITFWAIPGHFFILLFAISMFALFNFINFEELKITFTIVESLFGAYVGLIVSSLYKVNDKQATPPEKNISEE